MYTVKRVNQNVKLLNVIKMGKCIEEVNKPSVDESQIECCGVYPSNCVFTSQSDTYLKIGKGETLTNVITSISKFIKKIFQRLDSLDRYYEVTGNISQENTNNPVMSGYVSNLPQGFTLNRVSVGVYELTFSQPVLNTGRIISIANRDLISKIIKYEATTTSTISIETYDVVNGNILSDNLLDNESLHIKIPK